MKNFSPALITILILTISPALGHPGDKQDSRRGGDASVTAPAPVHQQAVRQEHVRSENGSPAIIGHPQSVRHERVPIENGLPAIIRHPQSVPQEHGRITQPGPFAIVRERDRRNQREQMVPPRVRGETPFAEVRPQWNRREHWRTLPETLPGVWNGQVIGERMRGNGERWQWNRHDREDRRRFAWWLRPVTQVAYVPIYVHQPYRYVTYWPQQPVFFTPIGNSQIYYTSTCYRGDADEDDTNSCYAYAAPVPQYGIANFISTPYYNRQVQGVVVATTGTTMLLLTPNLQPVFVNITPAEQFGSVQAGLRPGTFVDAYGYYSGNTFVATAVT
jgi:hypothetical protein